MNPEKDKHILELFREKNKQEEAFRILVNEYKVVLYRQIKNMLLDHDDTNDVLQNTFIKAWKGLEFFRAESSLKTWLYRIAANESLSFLQSQKKRKMFRVISSKDILAETLKSEQYTDYSSLEIKFRKAMLELPEKQRLVFQMKYYEELTFEEMSQILGQTTGGLKASYHLAVKKIEKYLTGD